MQNKLFFLILSSTMFLQSANFIANPNQDAEITIKKVRKTRREKRQERRAILKEKAGPKLISKGIRDQSEAELKHNLAIYIQRDNAHLIIKYLERLISKVTEFEEIRDLTLQLADVCSKNEQYEKSGSLYTNYYESYPGYEKAEYALFQAIMSKYHQIGECDQDTGSTKEVLDLSKQYLQNKSYQTYVKRVLDLFEDCNCQLLESEIKIFEHYFKQGHLGSAQRRLDYIAEKILPKMPDIKERIAVLQDLVNQAKKGKNPIRLLKRMNNNFPVKKINSANLERQLDLQAIKEKPYADQF